MSDRPTSISPWLKKMQGLLTGSGAMAGLLALSLCLSIATGFLFLKEIIVAGALLLFPLAVRSLTGTNV